MIPINEIMTLVYKVVGLPFVNSPKQFNKDNSLTINLRGIDIRAYRQRSLAFDEMFVMEFNGGDPEIIKSIVSSFSHKNALGESFISSIDVGFRNDVCPQILRDQGNFVESKDGWSRYHLHDLNGISFWQHAINFKKMHGEPNNDQWKMVWYVSWIWGIKK